MTQTAHDRSATADVWRRVMVGALAMAVAVTAAGAARAGGQAAPSPAAATKSVQEGVYTAAQAARGEETFQARCTTCHDNGRFTGNDFVGTWADKPLHDLFDIMRTTMPEDNPGSLKPQEYADILAFFLKLNAYPEGADELKGTAEAMKAVKMERKSR